MIRGDELANDPRMVLTLDAGGTNFSFSAIRSGQRLVIAAHGNSIRAMVKMLDGISDADIVNLNIPNGIPLVYELDADLKPIRSHYLGDPTAAAAAAAAVANQGRKA